MVSFIPTPKQIPEDGFESDVQMKRRQGRSTVVLRDSVTSDVTAYWNPNHLIMAANSVGTNYSLLSGLYRGWTFPVITLESRLSSLDYVDMLQGSMQSTDLQIGEIGTKFKEMIHWKQGLITVEGPSVVPSTIFSNIRKFIIIRTFFLR